MHSAKEIINRMTLLRSAFQSPFLAKRKIYKCPYPCSLSPFPFRGYSITKLFPCSLHLRHRSNYSIKLFPLNRCGSFVYTNSSIHFLADGELTIVLKKKEMIMWSCLEKKNRVEERMDSIRVDRPFLVLFHPTTKKVCVILQCTEGCNIQCPQIGKMSSESADRLHPTSSLLLQWKESNCSSVLDQKITVCAEVEVTSASYSQIVCPFLLSLFLVQPSRHRHERPALRRLCRFLE